MLDTDLDLKALNIKINFFFFLDKKGKPYVRDGHMEKIEFYNTSTFCLFELKFESTLARQRPYART